MIVLKHYEISSLFNLKKRGFSISEIGRKIGRSTTAIYNHLSKGKVNNSTIQALPIAKKLQPFEDYLQLRIKQGLVNGTKLFREIQERGYQGGYGSINRYLKAKSNLLESYKPARHVETRPGQQAQVDWGSFGKIEINGAIQRLYAFVYVLSYSRSMYVEFVIRQNQQTLQQCHMHAFEILGWQQSES